MKPCTVGLDVGGTKIAGGIVDERSGAVLSSGIVATRPERGGEAVLATALAMAEDLIVRAESLDRRVRGIGVGVAELVDLDGDVTSAHTIAWRGMPVQDRFSQLAPTVVDSDVRVAALGEALYGAGRPFKIFLYVTVGTGIGFCLVQEGRPYKGARGNAQILGGLGELVSAGCADRESASPSLLEDFAAGPALAARYNHEAQQEVGGAEDVLAAANADDPIAGRIVSTSGAALGMGVGWLVNALDPEAVVIGGGLGLAGGLYWSSVMSSFNARVWAEESRDLPILPASLGVTAGFVGAAAAVQAERPMDDRDTGLG